MQVLKMIDRHCNSITTLKLSSKAVKQMDQVLEAAVPSLTKCAACSLPAPPQILVPVLPASLILMPAPPASLILVPLLPAS